MCQKCEGKSGLWVLHEMVNKTYAENMKKNRGRRLGLKGVTVKCKLLGQSAI